MKPLVAAAALALAVAAPSLAAAQAPFLGARVGFGVPFGKVNGPVSHRDVITSVVPLQLDAGFKMGPLDVGAYFSYGFAQADSSCTASCSASTIRLGLQGDLHSELRPGREVWAGILFGYERLHLGTSGPDTTASGWEGGLQGGFDFASSTTGFGPYGSLTLGQFSSLDAGGVSGSISDRKFHGTLVLGVRGYFKI